MHQAEGQNSLVTSQSAPALVAHKPTGQDEIFSLFQRKNSLEDINKKAEKMDATHTQLQATCQHVRGYIPSAVPGLGCSCTDYLKHSESAL